MKQKKEWTQEQIEEAGKRIGNKIADYIFPALIIAALWVISIIYDIIYNTIFNHKWEESLATLLIACLYFTLIRCNKLEDKIEHIESKTNNKEWNKEKKWGTWDVVMWTIGVFIGISISRLIPWP